MVELYYQIKKCNGKEMINQLLAQRVLQQPTSSIFVNQKSFEDVMMLQRQERKEYFMTKEDIYFKFVLLQKDKSDESFDLFEKDLKKLTKKYICYKKETEERFGE